MTVTLDNVAFGRPVEYMASESSDFGGAVWLAYTTAPVFTLSASNGVRAIYFKVRNADGTESSAASDSILTGLDTLPPYVASFAINEGA